MDTIYMTSTIGSDGILNISLPLSTADANRQVKITVEPLSPAPMSQEEWRRRVLATAGKWEGEFERPDQGEYEVREPLS
jgi:hypothetical protein